MSLTRRSFLRTGFAGAAGLVLVGRWADRGATGAEASAGVCLTICNHWSYIGIGWQLGLESCVLSVTDAMEMADRPPHAKTCLNLDARAYEFMAEQFPEVTARLKLYLAAGRVELIGGTYGQPMGTTIGGESNIRQIVFGREVIRRALDYDLVTFLEEEEFTHPQIPQLARQAGFRYASLAQLDTWGRAGCPRSAVNVLDWQGLDGTAIPCVPKNALFGYAPDPKSLAAAAEFKQLAALGRPLIFAWEEFGWESPEQPAYLTSPARYQALAGVEFVTLREYLDKYGAGAKERVYFPMDAWNKSLTWGLGGDQVRILDRKTEALLLAAELFDGVASAYGDRSQVELLDRAWRNLLAAQSHDVGLCEYSRWQGDRMAPFDRIEDYHNFTWGAIGYGHLDAARKEGQAVLDEALRRLSKRVDTRAFGREQAVVVFNPHGWLRTDLVSTGRIHPVPARGRQIVVRDGQGRVIPSQTIRQDQDAEGRLAAAEVAFLAREVPSAGFRTYGLAFRSAATEPPPTSLRCEEASLSLENEFLRVRLDPATGGVASLVAKPAGLELLDPAQAAFPRFTGRPNPNLSRRPNPPAFYDSQLSKAHLDWTARGPLWATVRAQHTWQYLKFETRVTVAAGVPYVEVTSRVLAFVPPHSDASPPDIKEGYWLSLVPGFAVRRVERDFPFGVEETKQAAFHALTFADLLGADRGLLLLHAGTQYFQREPSGAFKNLAMREWESHFTREYGWPIYAEYRHALQPHAGQLTNADRLNAAAGFVRPLSGVVRPPGPGALPTVKSFWQVAPAGVRLSAFRKRRGAGWELRLVESEGSQSAGTVTTGLPLESALATDLCGRSAGEPVARGNRWRATLAPWQIRSFVVSR
jgi:alpha-mannosidase